MTHSAAVAPPDIARQTLRLKRYLMGASTSLLAAAALFISYWLGLLPLKIAVGGAALIGFFVVLFYGLFRSELNLRFRDPSLTTQMIFAAVLTLAYLMYHAPAARGALSLFSASSAFRSRYNIACGRKRDVLPVIGFSSSGTSGQSSPMISAETSPWMRETPFMKREPRAARAVMLKSWLLGVRPSDRSWSFGMPSSAQYRWK